MDADRAKYKFGGAVTVRAEAQGQPGQRRFALVLSVGAMSARLWLEKDQLRQFSVLVNELLESAEKPIGRSPLLPQLPPSDVSATSRGIEFQVGRMGLAFDTSRDAALVLVNDAEDQRQDAQPTVSFWLRRDQATELAKQAMQVVNSGRPQCPLCGGPMDATGHMCPKTNGHSKQQFA